MFSQRCEQERAVILDPKFAFQSHKVNYSRLAFGMPIYRLQVFLTKPELITPPPRGLRSGAVCMDIKEEVDCRLLVGIYERVKS